MNFSIIVSSLQAVSCIWLASCLVAISVVFADQPKELDLKVPEYVAAEGIMRFVIKGSKSEERSFRETFDADMKRGFAEVGDLYEPNPTVYHYMGSGTNILFSENGQCSTLADRYYMVPNLTPAFEHFLSVFGPGLKGYNYVIGPTRFLLAVATLAETKSYGKPKLNREDIHRGLRCNVYRLELGKTEDGRMSRFEAYLPNNIDEDESKWTKESMIAFAFYVSSDFSNPEETSVLSLDYYTYEKPSIEKWLNDFTLPLGVGCSRYAPKDNESKLGAELTFGAIYTQKSSLFEERTTFLAFDAKKRLIKKDVIGIGSTIYDIGQDMVYHLDNRNIEDLTNSKTEIKTTVKKCSVTNVRDATLNKHIHLKASRSATEFFDLENLALIGSSMVRDIPSAVYEKIVGDAPPIFFTRLEYKFGTEYIYQVYMIKTDSGGPNSTSVWWPTRLVLLEKNPSKTVVFSQIEIYDFSPFLSGWRLKASEMFDVSDCFDRGEERVKLEFSVSSDLTKSAWETLKQNQYYLENAAVDAVLDIFHLSRPHLSKMNVEIERNQLDFDLIVSEKPTGHNKIKFIGKGKLSKSIKNQVEKKGTEEDECVLFASLFDDVNMALSCPSDSGSLSCIVVYSENQGTLNLTLNDKDPTGCRVYRFYYATPLERSIIESLERDENNMNGESFEAFNDEGTQLYKGKIIASEVIRHNVIKRLDEYQFVLEKGSNKNRIIKDMNYGSVSDCSRVCQLDFACHSYSFCKNKRCILSSIDIADQWTVVGVESTNFNYDNYAQGMNSSTSESNEQPQTTDDTQPFKLVVSKECSIYEKNHLDLYTRTDDYFYVNRSLVTTYHPMSLIDCAKVTNKLEHRNLGEWHPTFAYCGHTRVCLADLRKTEQAKIPLFVKEVPTKHKSSSIWFSDYVLGIERCRIYRKRYQTYFQISTDVLEESDKNKQWRFEGQTLEECAHICWQKMGNDCGSFDYCSTQRQTDRITEEVCIINQLDIRAKPALKVNPQNNCYHYEKDRVLDKVRRQLDLANGFNPESNHGSKELSSRDDSKSQGSSTSHAVVSYIFMGVLLVVGVIVGDKINPRISELATLLFDRASNISSSINLRRPSGRSEASDHDVPMELITTVQGDRSPLQKEF